MTMMQEIQKTDMEEGRYLYCVVNSGSKVSFGKIGIDDAEVYTVPFRDIAVVVHQCVARPYETNDDKRAKRWIFTHNYVIDKATEQFGTVLPFSFDAISRGNEDAVKEWITKGYANLRRELERLNNKAEYSIQIFCDQEKLAGQILDEEQDLKELGKKIAGTPKKASYLLHRKFELMMKDALSVEVLRLAECYGSKIGQHAGEMKVEKTPQIPEKYRDRRLIVSLSCLVSKDEVEDLGKVLDEINNSEGYLVRFTGPWAPFSFVNL